MKCAKCQGICQEMCQMSRNVPRNVLNVRKCVRKCANKCAKCQEMCQVMCQMSGNVSTARKCVKKCARKGVTEQTLGVLVVDTKTFLWNNDRKSELKMFLSQVSKDKSYLDTCLKEACKLPSHNHHQYNI